MLKTEHMLFVVLLSDFLPGLIVSVGKGNMEVFLKIQITRLNISTHLINHHT